VLLGNTWRVSVLGVVLSLVVLSSGASDQAPKQSTRHIPVVEDLVQLLQARPALRAYLPFISPRVLGLYGIPGAPHNPDEWSSLFIAVALWGGPWALARGSNPSRRPT
jgi:hypothetical protein